MMHRQQFIRWMSGALSLLVHAVLLISLLWSMNWSTQDTAVVPVQVGLMMEMPSALPVPVVVPKVLPDIAKTKMSAPAEDVKPIAQISAPMMIKAKPPKPVEPVRVEKKKLVEPVAKLPPKPPEPLPAKPVPPVVKPVADRVEVVKNKSLPEKDPRQDLLKNMMADAGREQSQMTQQINTAALTQKAMAESDQLRKSREEGDLQRYVGRIKAKIKPFIVIPVTVKNNPLVEIDIVQLPTGEVLSTHIVRSSEDVVLDQAVERAIMRASPLPLPDPASLFRRNLRLRFRPDE